MTRGRRRIVVERATNSRFIRYNPMASDQEHLWIAPNYARNARSAG